MRSFAFFLIFSSFCINAAEVFFVPGWQTGFHRRTGCVRILQDVYPGCRITVKSWDSKRSWHIAEKNAEAYTKVLCDEILSMPDPRRRELILVGHSIGARIVVDVLDELGRRGQKVHSAALLGGLLANDDKKMEKMLEAIRYNCCIIYNPDDWLLKIFFPLVNRMKISLGEFGWRSSDERVFESRARNDLWAFFNHYAYIYLEELDRLVEMLPPIEPEIEVAQDEENIIRIPADQLYWDDQRICKGWKLQKNCFSGKFRILDSRGKRRAQGIEKIMNDAFDGVEKKLSEH